MWKTLGRLSRGFLLKAWAFVIGKRPFLAPNHKPCTFLLSRITFNAVSASSLALLWMVCLNGSIWAQTSSNGCTNPYACNYDAEAAEDDGSCEFESCQWCPDPEACNYEGEGFPWTANPFLCHYIEGDECDCEGNVPDALGECGGSCASDEDGDGICDDVDPCVGSLDNCGICNGPGAVYDCGCTPIPEGDCDCEGTQVDAIGVCGGSCLAMRTAMGCATMWTLV